jgi:hypothetical protein
MRLASNGDKGGDLYARVFDKWKVFVRLRKMFKHSFKVLQTRVEGNDLKIYFDKWRNGNKEMIESLNKKTKSQLDTIAGEILNKTNDKLIELEKLNEEIGELGNQNNILV